MRTIPICDSCVTLGQFLGPLNLFFLCLDSGKQKLTEGEADDPPRLLFEKGMSPLRIPGEPFEQNGGRGVDGGVPAVMFDGCYVLKHTTWSHHFHTRAARFWNELRCHKDGGEHGVIPGRSPSE